LNAFSAILFELFNIFSSIFYNFRKCQTNFITCSSIS